MVQQQLCVGITTRRPWRQQDICTAAVRSPPCAQHDITAGSHTSAFRWGDWFALPRIHLQPRVILAERPVASLIEWSWTEGWFSNECCRRGRRLTNSTRKYLTQTNPKLLMKDLSVPCCRLRLLIPACNLIELKKHVSNLMESHTSIVPECKKSLTMIQLKKKNLTLIVEQIKSPTHFSVVLIRKSWQRCGGDVSESCNPINRTTQSSEQHRYRTTGIRVQQM